MNTTDFCLVTFTAECGSVEQLFSKINCINSSVVFSPSYDTEAAFDVWTCVCRSIPANDIVRIHEAFLETEFNCPENAVLIIDDDSSGFSKTITGTPR